MERHSYKAIISSLGRSHLVVAADAIVRVGGDVDIVEGWVPRNLDSLWVRIASKIIGRGSFVKGLAKRRTLALEGRIKTVPFAEFVQTLLNLSLARFSQRLSHLCLDLSFRLFGWGTRKYLTKDYAIFHVRSGVGRGGAIRKAKRMGMKVLVDHCVPHPLSMKKTTGEKGYDEPWSYWNGVMKDCEEADLVMVGSEYVKDTFVEFGYSAEKIKVVPLGVLPVFSHVKKEYSKNGCLELVYTGNWGQWKGVDDLIDSIDILCQRGIDVHLSVAGSHIVTSPSYIKAVSKNLPVTFLGHIPQEDLRNVLAKADIYVFPSLRDGFAVSAFEGMAAGLCLVTTRESSIPVREGETGYVIPSHSPASIADRIEYLDRNRHLIEKIGRRAADEVESKYTWENYARNVLHVYDELMTMER